MVNGKTRLQQKRREKDASNVMLERKTSSVCTVKKNKKDVPMTQR